MNLTPFDPTPSRVRTIELENGNILRMTAKDPYGLIYLSLEHGQLPDSLKDAAYTDWRQAEKAAQAYIAQRTKVLAELAEAEKTEAPKVKKTKVA